MTSAPITVEDVALCVCEPRDDRGLTAAVIRLFDESGHEGLAEISRPHHAVDVVAFLGSLLDIGHEALDLDRSTTLAHHGHTSLERAVGTALSTAWHDLQARQEGQHLATYLGGVRRPVLTFARLWLDAVSHRSADASDLIGAAELAASIGHQDYLLAPFVETASERPLVAGLDLLTTVREVVSPNTNLRVDLCSDLALNDVRCIGSALRDLHVGTLHNAAPVEDLDTLHALREEFPFTLTSVVTSAAQAKPAIDRGLLDAVYLDLRHGAGPVELLTHLQELRAAGVQVGVCGATGPISTAVGGHVLGALGLGHLEVPVTANVWRQSGVVPAGRLPGGTWLAGPGVGTGLWLDADAWTADDIQYRIIAS
ncbi:mandelate racemase/muconate lactonizing enzyme family protein [Demetria terragena]|uniref:mandelate racemase/muconate lactonizing enzyme family protein n=1 Tax=Demetria terragena TaxID=63959 RepID=UPI0003706FD7|nr:mandelate racemase/muconate lactonizing enzyme family protein [Demetria terragena]